MIEGEREGERETMTDRMKNATIISKSGLFNKALIGKMRYNTRRYSKIQ